MITDVVRAGTQDLVVNFDTFAKTHSFAHMASVANVGYRYGSLNVFNYYRSIVGADAIRESENPRTTYARLNTEIQTRCGPVDIFELSKQRNRMMEGFNHVTIIPRNVRFETLLRHFELRDFVLRPAAFGMYDIITSNFSLTVAPQSPF
ncbi:MAG TPA: hypothetical protein VK158_06725 [Acidobacteriota bacterium]|nr:hypothetical protein [Acidobacteriota bacterium]